MSFRSDQLLPGEKLVRITHQSSIVLLKPVIVNLVAAAVLAALYVMLDVPWLLLFYLIPLALLVWEAMVRRSREYVVTDRRVVKQEGIFTVHSFDAPLDKINNIFHEQNLLGRLFRFGTVGLETASEQGTTLFHYIPDPIGFKNSIVSQREMYKAAGSGAAAAPPAPNIPRLLDELAALRDRNVISEREFEEKKKALLDKL